MKREKTLHYIDTDMFKMLKKRYDSEKPLILVLTDVDNTVRIRQLHPRWWLNLDEQVKQKTLTDLGLSQQLEVLDDIDVSQYIKEKREKDLKKKSFELISFAHERNIPYGYVTGADIEKVLGRISEYQKDLPVPLAIASAVGTELYFKMGVDFVEDKAYQEELKTRFHRTIMEQIGIKLIEDKTLSQLFEKGGFELQFQPNLKDQTDYKVSFHFFARDLNDVEKVVQRFYHEIDELNKQRVRKGDCALEPRILYAAEVDWNNAHATSVKKKYCIDLLAGTKDDAINFIVEKMNEALPHDAPPINLLVAGDSGNDEALLRNTQIPRKTVNNTTLLGRIMAVIVGGSDEELERKMQKGTVSLSKERSYILHLQEVKDLVEERGREILNGLEYNRLFQIDERGPETVKRALSEFEQHFS